MKKTYNICAALAAVAMIFTAASCSKQETPITPEEPSAAQTVTLTASMELPDSDTKTSLGSGNTVLWSEGDEISVFFGENTDNTEFTLNTGSGETSGSFTGTPSEESSTIYAVYPYNSTTSITVSTVTLSLPAVQTYKEGGFDEGMNPAVAYTTTGGNLTFKNLCGVLKLQLNVSEGTKTIKKISVYNPTGKLSGTGTVLMTDEIPALTMSSTASSSVTLDLGEGVTLTTESKTFYIVVPAMTGTYTVTVLDSEGKTMTKSTSSSITRNKIRPMPESPYTADAYTNLSSEGTANCYIVPATGNYSFDATVIGNGLAGFLPDVANNIKKFHKATSAENATIAPLSAKVLWQDVDGLITDISYSGGKVSFKASSGKGNAVIAVYSGENATGNILWSWHIWCTDRPDTQNYVNAAGSAFTLLDRNLGATSASADEASYGLYYQWGRKDPFSRNDSHLTKEATSSEKGTIANTVAHPTTYYYNSSSPYDWHYAERNNYLWGNPEGYNTPYTAVKSIYDPCPPGYMVAPKDTWTYFSTSTGTWNNTGYTFNTNSGEGTTWYPAAGYRLDNDGSLGRSGSYGYYWSSTPSSSVSYGAGSLFFHSSNVLPLSRDNRAFGFSVRCSHVL